MFLKRKVDEEAGGVYMIAIVDGGEIGKGL